MRFMNEYDIEHARIRFGGGPWASSETPNRFALAVTVGHLAAWADRNSDGWAYWPKPARAADRAMSLIESRTHRENEEQERHDCTAAELTAALRPIKAFLTRQGVSAEERAVILAAVS